MTGQLISGEKFEVLGSNTAGRERRAIEGENPVGPRLLKVKITQGGSAHSKGETVQVDADDEDTFLDS